MRVQRLHSNNYMPQFNGTIKVKKGRVSIAQMQIPQQTDEKLCRKFVEILGREPEKRASYCGSRGNTDSINDYVNYVVELLKTKISTKSKNSSENLFYSYTSDGNGNLRYQIGFLSNPYTIEHSLHRGENYLLAKTKSRLQ